MKKERNWVWWIYRLTCVAGLAFMFYTIDFLPLIFLPLIPGVLELVLPSGAFFLGFLLLSEILEGTLGFKVASTTDFIVVALILSVVQTVVVKNQVVLRKVWLWIKPAIIDIGAWCFMAFDGSGRSSSSRGDTDLVGGHKHSEKLRKVEAVLMNQSDEKPEFKQWLAERKNAWPDLSDILSVSPTSGQWFTNLKQRVLARSYQKNLVENIKLVELGERYWLANSAVLAAERVALESQDDLARVKRGDIAKAKDEEAEISSLDRKKRKLALQKEITELEKPKPAPEPRQEPDRRSTADKQLAEMDEVDMWEEKELAECKGNPERMKRVKLLAENRRHQIIEKY